MFQWLKNALGYNKPEVLASSNIPDQQELKIRVPVVFYAEANKQNVSVIELLRKSIRLGLLAKKDIIYEEVDNQFYLIKFKDIDPLLTWSDEIPIPQVVRGNEVLWDEISNNPDNLQVNEWIEKSMSLYVRATSMSIYCLETDGKYHILELD